MCCIATVDVGSIHCGDKDARNKLLWFSFIFFSS